VTKHSVEAIVAALNSAQVRYLIAGGLAVVAHGFVRFTADVDVILDLDAGNLGRAIEALEKLGYRPRAPVPLRDFKVPEKREEWVRDKALTVFSLYSPEHQATEVDLFVEAPLDFDEAFRAATRLDVAPGIEAVFVGYDDLVRLKRRAGRPSDLADIEQLKAIRSERQDD
jgi:hypothetical protein